MSRKYSLTYELEAQDEWKRWMKEIPFIQWPPEWKIKAVPPFSGAIVRYVVQTQRCDWVSVYLDCYDRLGCYGSPYWEVYPHGGDVGRCAMEDTPQLLRMIFDAGKEPSDE